MFGKVTIFSLILYIQITLATVKHPVYRILMDTYFERTALLTGAKGMEIFAGTSVIVFGCGGVGSWCIEALVRSGIGSITIVDPDNVAASNINRQLPALASTIGRPKVEVLAERLARINPQARITAIKDAYTAMNAHTFNIESYDFAIDAIDSLTDKAHLILRCTQAETAPRKAFFASMGAARKNDISQIRQAEFWKVEGCPLARALRTRFRRNATYPQRKFRCVYSPQTLPQQADAPANGTFVHATGAFGLHLASMVVNSLYTECLQAAE